MVKSLKVILCFFVLSNVFFGCKNDINTCGKWEDITVVYGLLNISDSIHYLRIQKAFLGEGNFIEMAKIEDSSSYFNNLDVTIDEIQNNAVIRTIYFDTTYIYNKKAGTFYNNKQLLYKSKNIFYLRKNCLYKLNIKNIQSGKIVTSSTNIVDLISLKRPSYGPSDSIDITYPVLETSQFKNQNISWEYTKNASEYQVIFRFNYQNFYSNYSESKYIDLNSGIIKAKETEEGYYENFNFLRENFWKNLNYYLTNDVNPNIKYRKAKNIEIIIFAANNELKYYISNTDNNSSLLYYKNPVTNINNGYGIFASKNSRVFTLNIKKNTIRELVIGKYTNSFGFVY